MGSFDRLLPLLPLDMFVLAPDLRGHGYADQPDSGYDLEAFAADIPAFLDALELPTAVLLGSSSGGYVAQRAALDCPSRVAGLVLVGAPRTLHGRPAFVDDVEQLTDPIDPAWVRASLDWIPRLTEVPEWYLEDRVNDGMRMPARVWRDTLVGLVEAAPPTEMGEIVTPTLIIWGAGDELLTLDDEQAMSAAIRGSQLIVYENTGHLVLWERPERVAADVIGFMAEIS